MLGRGLRHIEREGRSGHTVHHRHRVLRKLLRGGGHKHRGEERECGVGGCSLASGLGPLLCAGPVQPGEEVGYLSRGALAQPCQLAEAALDMRTEVPEA